MNETEVVFVLGALTLVFILVILNRNKAKDKKKKQTKYQKLAQKYSGTSGKNCSACGSTNVLIHDDWYGIFIVCNNCGAKTNIHASKELKKRRKH